MKGYSVARYRVLLCSRGGGRGQFSQKIVEATSASHAAHITASHGFTVPLLVRRRGDVFELLNRTDDGTLSRQDFVLRIEAITEAIGTAYA